MIPAQSLDPQAPAFPRGLLSMFLVNSKAHGSSALRELWCVFLGTKISELRSGPQAYTSPRTELTHVKSAKKEVQ